MKTNNIAKSTHIPALDGLRGIAILMVLCCHLALSSAIPAATTLSGHIVRGLMTMGWTGVDLFFVLSGFLITGILIDTRNYANRAGRFYLRRCLRILPLYYLTVVLAFLVASRFPWMLRMYPDPAGWLSYALYVQNWWMPLREPTHSLLSHYWSLGIEEQFYLFWPVVVWRTPPKYLARVCAAGMAAVLVARLVLEHYAPPELILFSTGTRMDTLLYGALCAVVVRDERLNRIARVIAPYCLAVAISGMALIAFVFHEVFVRAFYTRTFGLSLIAAGYSAVLFMAYRGSAGGILTAKPLRIFGKYSYGIYVYHWPILGVAEHVWKKTPYAKDTAMSAVFCLGFIAVSLLIAVISYETFEIRFLRLKDRHASRNATPEKSALAATLGAG